MKYLLALLLLFSTVVFAQETPSQFSSEKYLKKNNSYDNRWWESETISGTSHTKIFLDRSSYCKYYNFPTNVYGIGGDGLSKEIYVLVPMISKDRLPDCSGKNEVLVDE